MIMVMMMMNMIVITSHHRRLSWLSSFALLVKIWKDLNHIDHPSTMKMYITEGKGQTGFSSSLLLAHCFIHFIPSSQF